MNKKLSILISMFVLATIIFFSCGDSAKTTTVSNTDTTKTATVVYTCSMHPEVISDKPGKCPKCGMDLIIKK